MVLFCPGGGNRKVLAYFSFSFFINGFMDFIYNSVVSAVFDHKLCLFYVFVTGLCKKRIGRRYYIDEETHSGALAAMLRE